MSENHSLLKEWKNHQQNVLERIFPELPEKKIKKFLKNEIDKNLINRDVVVHNNYFHGAKPMKLLDVVDWIGERKPIIAGFGMFYMNQHESINPNAEMLRSFIKGRKTYKDQLKVLKPGTYEYQTADRMQLTEKVNANAFYGCNGSRVSRFYNIYTAASVTLTGQSLNSTTGQAFEAFLMNNVKFYDLDNCFTYLENIRNESFKGAPFNILPVVTVNQVADRLKGMFYDFHNEYEFPIFKYLMNSSQKELKAFFFKNNLYDFSKIPFIEERTITVLHKVERFENPNIIPDEIDYDMKELWSLYRQFVFYNYPTWDRIHRMKNAPRRVVPMADTDSNFVHLDPWVQYLNELISRDEVLTNKDSDTLWYASINIMCFYLTKMINEVLFKYTALANIPEEFRHQINMKNEFLYSKIFTTPTKKRYIGSIRLREGEVLLPEKLDIKGWTQPFMLATA